MKSQMRQGAGLGKKKGKHQGNVCPVDVRAGQSKHLLLPHIVQMPCSQQHMQSQQNSPELQNHPIRPRIDQKPLRSSLATFNLVKFKVLDIWLT